MRITCLFILLLAAFSVSAKTTVVHPAAPLSDSLEQYTGKYKFESGPVAEVEVTLENGTLKVISAQGTSSLVKTEEADVFTLVEYEGKATFKRNEEKKIVGIKIEVMGMVLEGNKEEK